MSKVNKEELVKNIVEEIKKDMKPKVIRKTTNNVASISKDELNELFDAYIVGTILQKDPTETNFFQKDKANFSKDWEKTDFADFIPGAYSNQVIEEVFPKTIAAQLFPKIAMKQNPYKIPVMNFTRNAWLKSEGVAFNHKLVGSSGKVLLEAKTLMTSAGLTDELSEDSIIPLLPRIRTAIVDSIAYAVEDAIINGQSTAALDNDVTDSDDHRKAWDGLRYFAHDASRNAKAEVDMSTFDVAHLLAMRSNMGKYGLDVSKLTFLIPPDVMYKFLGLSELLTIKDYGQNAILLKGEIGRLFNIPIVVSPVIRTDLDSTGVNSATPANNVTTEMFLVYTGAWDIGVWKDVKFEPYREPTVGNVLYASTRMDFKPEYSGADDITVVAGINI